jgi:hypothetical protein
VRIIAAGQFDEINQLIVLVSHKMCDVAERCFRYPLDSSQKVLQIKFIASSQNVLERGGGFWERDGSTRRA